MQVKISYMNHLYFDENIIPIAHTKEYLEASHYVHNHYPEQKDPGRAVAPLLQALRRTIADITPWWR